MRQAWREAVSMRQEGTATSFAGLYEQRRKQAMIRFAVLRPCLEEGVPLTRAASEAGIPVRTAERWLARYRRGGLVGLARHELLFKLGSLDKCRSWVEDRLRTMPRPAKWYRATWLSNARTCTYP